MSRFFGFQDRCEICGRFVSIAGAGVSWSQTWSYQMDGTPELDDPRYRCSPCTDTHGIGWTNCAPSYPGNGRNSTGEGGQRPRAPSQATDEMNK